MKKQKCIKININIGDNLDEIISVIKDNGIIDLSKVYLDENGENLSFIYIK